MLESLHAAFPSAKIDLVVRKGNESLFNGHPFIQRLIVWDKSGGRYKKLWRTIREVRECNYDTAINAHRFASSGIMTWLSRANEKIGFDKNPMSFAFTKTVKHTFSGKHECARNHQLIHELVGEETFHAPKLYPSISDSEVVREFQSRGYRCIAPTSVWHTKQWPAGKWIELIKAIPEDNMIYLLGAQSDTNICDEILKVSNRKNVVNLAGKLSLLQSAELMRQAEMNYVNDSAPMHLASSVNAKTTAVYCSTVPEFGFGPLSDESRTVQVQEKLSCRPCGIHGLKACPEGHFNCAELIKVDQVV